MLKNKTAILIFARSIKEELKHKPFLAQNSLISELHNTTINTAKQTGLPVLICNETSQTGRNFGERYTNAIEHIFNIGYSNVITIGNDCPELKLEHIINTKKALHHQKIGIGGTYDGGFYLLGISKEIFDRNSFLNFNWGSATLYKEITSHFEDELLDLLILPKLRDIDFFADLKRIQLHKIKDVTLRDIISSIILKHFTIYFVNQLKALLIPKRIVFNKGSPLFYFI